MAPSTRASSETAKCMAKGHSPTKTETGTRASGVGTVPVGMAPTPRNQVMAMMASGWPISTMAEAPRFGKMETNTPAIFALGKKLAMATMSWLTDLFTKENGLLTK